jgi:hypothetical protein
LWIEDLALDGYSVGIHWRTSGRRGICRNKHGYRDVVPYPNYRCDKNFPENQRIEIRLGRCDGSTGVSCRSLSHWFGWTDWSAANTG